MKKLINLVRQAPKRAAGILMVLAAVLVPAALLAWGPDRPTFTYGHPAPYVTFNSITDNPKVGDERNFVRIREAASGATFGDDITLTTGKTYEVMVFYHNNAASNLNENGTGIAKDVTARVQMPGRLDAGDTATITGFVNSSNANPGTVWDSARATTVNAVALRYVPNSAKIASSNGAVSGASLSSDLLTTGVKLGYDSLNGTLPGCNEYSGYITYQFVVDQPNFSVNKQVSVDGGKTWVESAKTTPGATVQYKLSYQNTGTVQQDNVILKDTLPTGVSYIPGSSQIANSKTGGQYQSTVDGVTSAGGYKLGSYAPKGNAYLKFSAKVADNKDLPKCGDNTLSNKVVTYTENGSKSDTADITVRKDLNDCTEVVTPEVPTELPTTGPTETILSVFGVGGLIAGASYYLASRRSILGR
ncbi:MAG: hypothetical protein ACSLEY_03495 [Candidatus Saccharimonadales bacterium]